MELKDVLMARRSIRKYTEEPVSEEDINELLHAAMSGPSACNKKPWEFFVVTNPDVLNKLRAATCYSNMPAPLAIVVAGNTDRALPTQAETYWIQDGSAATENILLRAVDLNLGAVWCGVTPMPENMKNVSEALNLPENIKPLNILWIGHPAESHCPRDQYDEACVHYLK